MRTPTATLEQFRASSALLKKQGSRRRGSTESPPSSLTVSAGMPLVGRLLILFSFFAARYWPRIGLWKTSLQSICAAARCTYATHPPRDSLTRQEQDARTALPCVSSFFRPCKPSAQSTSIMGRMRRFTGVGFCFCMRGLRCCPQERRGRGRHGRLISCLYVARTFVLRSAGHDRAFTIDTGHPGLHASKGATMHRGLRL